MDEVFEKKNKNGMSSVEVGTGSHFLHASSSVSPWMMAFSFARSLVLFQRASCILHPHVAQSHIAAPFKIIRELIPGLAGLAHDVKGVAAAVKNVRMERLQRNAAGVRINGLLPLHRSQQIDRKFLDHSGDFQRLDP
jgi:hypothetical protein